jgi:hypothetical protein
MSMNRDSVSSSSISSGLTLAQSRAGVQCLGELGRGQLRARDVDRDLGAVAGIVEVARMTRAGEQAPFAEADYQAGLFGDGDELDRGDQFPVHRAAHQRLDRLDPAVEADDGLVVQAQAAVLEREVQLVLDGQFLAGEQDAEPAGHRLFARGHGARAALALGGAHGAVGAFEEGEGVLVGFEDGDADAGRGMEEEFAEAQRGFDGLQQVLRQLPGAFRIAVGDQADELVAAHAAPFAASGGFFAQAPGDLGNDQVAAEVAEGLIDLLQAAQIDPQRRQRLAAGSRTESKPACQFEATAAVEKACARISALGLHTGYRYTSPARA